MLKYGVQGLFKNHKITLILVSYLLIWILIYVFFLNLSF